MSAYTPGDRYVTLGDIIRTVLECAIILALVVAAGVALERGWWVRGLLALAIASIALALTIILAAMSIKR